MKSLTIYRILTFLLVPVAVLFGFMDLMILVSALANPALLIFVFMFGCFVIYIFSSLKFFSKGIEPGRPVKSSLRDWIRVNAFVSGFMGSIFLLNAFSIFLMSDITLRQVITQFTENQPNVPANLSPELFLQMMKFFAWFISIVSIVLLIQIRMTFRLLKQYKHLFSE